MTIRVTNKARAITSQANQEIGKRQGKIELYKELEANERKSDSNGDPAVSPNTGKPEQTDISKK